MSSGIYLITAPNGRRYVGSATNLSCRKANHWHHLARGTHANRHLQRTWNKYKDGFVFEVLLLCSRANLLMYEQIAIDALQPELNICKTAGSSIGVKHSEATRQRYKAAAKRRVARDAASHAEKTAKAHKAMRQLFDSPERRAKWHEKVKEHGETMAKQITWQGRTQSITKWANEFGVPRTTLKSRIANMGLEDAFSLPFVGKHSEDAMLLRNARRGVTVYEVDGKQLTKTGLALLLGVSRVTVRDWEKKGLSLPEMQARAKELNK